MRTVSRTFRWLLRETRGIEIAETAAILPILFAIVMGIFWFGQAFRMYGTITRAAEDGARAGAAPYCSTCNPTNGFATNASNAVNSSLQAANLDPTQAIYPATPPPFTACGSALTSCNVAVTNVCVQGPVLITNLSTGGAGVCGMSVSFQYPFSMHVPFANPTVYLQASARVHMETQ